MKRIVDFAMRILRAIGREIAATIRAGAIPAGAAPVGYPAQPNAAATVAGIGVIRDGASSPDESQTNPD